MIWQRLMELFCKCFGHAMEYEDFQRWCVRCGNLYHDDLGKLNNTSNAINRTWKP